MASDVDDYRYRRFTTGLLSADLRFGRDGLRPGQRLERTTFVGADGERIDPGSSPFAIVSGSQSCPMTDASLPFVGRLHRRCGSDVAFLVLSSREAHPGEFLGQVGSDSELIARARDLAAHVGPGPTVVVDDLAGTLHRRLGAKPNAFYLFDESGELVFRSLWASDEVRITEAVEAVIAGIRPPRSQSRAMLGPMRLGLSRVAEVMDRAGPQAWRDLWRSAPPMAFMGRVASRLRRRREGGSARAAGT